MEENKLDDVTNETLNRKHLKDCDNVGISKAQHEAARSDGK